jgi:putative membrane protein
MIRSYSDHSANERTFLAWLRTAVAVVAFGVVIEKLNLFVLAVARTSAVDAASRERLERLSGPIGRYDGLALIVVGIVLIVVAAVRFIRIERLIDDRDEHAVGSARTEMIVSAVLVLIVAGLSIYLAVS